MGEIKGNCDFLGIVLKNLIKKQVVEIDLMMLIF